MVALRKNVQHKKERLEAAERRIMALDSKYERMHDIHKVCEWFDYVVSKFLMLEYLYLSI